MTDLNLHDSMIERAAERLIKAHDIDAEYAHDTAREMIKAAFEGVPMTNYSIGTLLDGFDLVILVKEHPHSAAALVCRREGDRPASEGFETLGHYVTVEWGSKPQRYISAVKVSKLDPPEALADAA